VGALAGEIPPGPPDPAAEIAWDLDWKTSGAVVARDNRKAARVYDDAVLRILSLSDDPSGMLGKADRELLIPGPRGGYALTIDPRTVAALADYPRMKAASDYRGNGGFRQRIIREGVGVPLVGINREGDWSAQGLLVGRDRMKRREGYTTPRTAVLLFDQPVAQGGTRKVKLAVVDPRKVAAERIGKRSLPVAADFTAPLMAAYPRFGGNLWPALRAAINPDIWLPFSGLHALERYDPERIPVVLVHGLFSTPDMWKDLINELSATAGIGANYQFYVFTYPTGLSPAYTATMLRERLRAVSAARTLPRGYVLIGHSMGGILSRLQITDSGTEIWNEAFGDNAATAMQHSGPDDVIQRSLIFKADPKVRQVIFACVPHRGSPVASKLPVRFFARLARMPLHLTNELAGSPLRAMGVLPARLPSSADGLSPRSPVLLAMDRLPMQARVYSIIGNRGRPGPLEQSSDGIVPYWSSHQQAALSETIVPTGHGGFDHPLAVDAMRRILATGLRQAPGLPERHQARR
jgi:pimeloyl-ACP methyl ester carboxylesterase